MAEAFWLGFGLAFGSIGVALPWLAIMSFVKWVIGTGA